MTVLDIHVVLNYSDTTPEPLVSAEDMLAIELRDVETHLDDVISGVNEEDVVVPTVPLCNTVRTETSGRLDTLGKSLPGIIKPLFDKLGGNWCFVDAIRSVPFS